MDTIDLFICVHSIENIIETGDPRMNDSINFTNPGQRFESVKDAKIEQPVKPSAMLYLGGTYHGKAEPNP
ncbi:hypothetical protein BpHYR1_028846 [Brachionus plicatilis]|uniref:Uncharacterized protein n=1 Tax=Brachionus plicatilis TaxID=10195 RepID=A0A3M7P0Z3_BRAPC|nr:hypothetical protein BpHYR1_028846 [Brachionus plicatilis]